MRNDPGVPVKKNGMATAIRLIAALAILWFVLVLPNSPYDLNAGAFLRFPLELVAVVLLLSVCRGLAFRLVQFAVTLILAGMLFLKLADLGVEKAFLRPFNPYLDIKLLFDGWNILSGSIGQWKAFAIVAVTILLWLAVAFLFFKWIVSLQRMGSQERRGLAMVSGALLVAGGAVVGLTTRTDAAYHVDAKAASFLVNRIASIRESITDMAAFERELDKGHQDLPGLAPQMQALAGKDIVLVFVESYGRSAVQDPLYAPTVDRRLSLVENELHQAGLSSVSGWLTSPTVSGLSWLAHGTMLSGLWVNSQGRYDRLISSSQPTLNKIFQANGWRTVAVMPAITRDWIESGYFGYDAIYASGNLGYKGKRFNWVTMPDQFTLQAFENRERQPGHKPLMAEMALISSHAPWTPIPKLVDWNAIGDGTIFNEQATAGDSPETVWANEDRIRQQYRASIDYTLETLGSYMARYGNNTVFILLGDHQPAPVITGKDASRDVPIHIVTSDRNVLNVFRNWGWNEGMKPDDKTAVYPMGAFREKFLNGFTHPAIANRQ